MPMLMMNDARGKPLTKIQHRGSKPMLMMLGASPSRRNSIDDDGEGKPESFEILNHVEARAQIDGA